MIRLLLTSCIVFQLNYLSAQVPDLSAHRDCDNPLEIVQCFVPELKVPERYGNKLDISGHSIRSPHFFTREHNTLWIKLIFVRDTNFVFELIPTDPNEDFDFIIFKNEDNLCDKISKKQVLPLRSNLSRINPEMGSRTGLKEGYENEFAPAGRGNAFSAPLSVKAGEEYIMVIDCPYGSKSGFRFVMDSTMFVTPPVVEEKPVVKNPYPNVYLQFMEEGVPLQLTDKDFVVKGIAPEESLSFDNQTALYYIENVARFRTYSIQVNKKGYEPYGEIYSQRQEIDTTLVVELRKLKIGTKLQFENIHFVMDRAQILPESEPELKKIVLFLKSNPGMHVEIMGHVNGPGAPNKRKYRKLSSDRARAVYEYLKKNGVEADRLTHAGYGNTQMVFTNPSGDAQSKANRRVELRVTKL